MLPEEAHPQTRQRSFYDLYVKPSGRSGRHYTFEEARQLVSPYQALGEDYVNVMKQAFDSRWIDVYENKANASAPTMREFICPRPTSLLNFKGAHALQRRLPTVATKIRPRSDVSAVLPPLISEDASCSG